MKTFFLSSLLALLAVGGEAANSAGCGKAAGISSGTYSITVNGKQRQYIVRVPQNYNPNNAYRLIFTLHWRDGSMNDAASLEGGFYGLQALAKESAIFVAPDGLNHGWANSGGEDLKFIDALVEKMDQSLCVDSTQRFSTGWSYGGGMSYEIACARAKQFRAVALFSGAQLSGCDGGNDPIAFWIAHGTHDSVLPFSMGQGLRDHFLKVNGCQNKDAPSPSNGSGTHTKTEYQCSAGYPVWWYAHDGDHTPNPQDRGQSQSWGPGETWKFFTQWDGSNPTTTPTPTSTTSTPQPTSTSAQPTPTPTPTPSQPTGGSPLWGQCGGIGWNGPTTCAQGSCRKFNDYYSQCQ